MKSKRIIVILGIVCILALAAGIQSTLAANQNQKDGWLEFGGRMDVTGIMSLGSGFPPVPGGKIRGLVIGELFTSTTTGPAADFMNGFAGPVTFYANLDENMSGPFWATFEWSKGEYTYAGTCNGQMNWAFTAGSNKCEGTVTGPGIRHAVLINDTVTPGDGPSYVFGRLSGLPED